MALVTSISSMFKENSESSQGQRRANMLKVLDKTLQQYYDKLNQGRIKINSTIDLERIIRSSVLLMGEQVTNPNQETPKVDKMSPIEDDDPDIKTLYQKLYSKYNQVNDTN